jgi:hypothetical protein
MTQRARKYEKSPSALPGNAANTMGESILAEPDVRPFRNGSYLRHIVARTTSSDTQRLERSLHFREYILESMFANTRDRLRQRLEGC